MLVGYSPSEKCLQKISDYFIILPERRIAWIGLNWKMQ